MLIDLNLKPRQRQPWHLHLICFLPTNPKNTPLCRKQWEEEDFPYPTLFRRFNLQTIQTLKAKNNPKQTH